MRKVLILGLGHVGKALSRHLREAGVRVVGTTTTAAKVDSLLPHADDVHVLRGTDTEHVCGVAAGCDAVIVTVAPRVRESRTPEERAATYRDTLVASCQSAAAAHPRVLFLSSFSVYGDGGPGTQPIDENTEVANQTEPSARYYSQAERMTLSTGRSCVLRLPDIYGAPGDMSFADRVRLAHQIMGGRVPFGADALLYTIHFEDVAAAAEHALRKNLTGIYNACPDDALPRTNAEVFGELCRRHGLPALEFLGQIRAPTRRISAQKLYATGWRPKFSDVDHPLREAA